LVKASQRGDGIDDGQAVVLARQFRQHFGI
jgi:hypothetical protein